MILTIEQLRRILPQAPRPESLIGPLNAAMARHQVNTARRGAEFLAQIGHESVQLACTRENLNYSIGSLRRVWPKRFPTDAVAVQYAHQPEKLANFVYANLYGNGDTASGDGWHYRGAGYLQHTFKANHAQIGRAFGIAVEKVGEWLDTPEGAAMGAAWYWQEHRLNELADKGDTDAISDIINLGHRTVAVGDAIGFMDRKSLRDAGYEVLGVA